MAWQQCCYRMSQTGTFIFMCRLATVKHYVPIKCKLTDKFQCQLRIFNFTRRNAIFIHRSIIQNVIKDCYVRADSTEANVLVQDNSFVTATKCSLYTMQCVLIVSILNSFWHRYHSNSCLLFLCKGTCTVQQILKDFDCHFLIMALAKIMDCYSQAYCPTTSNKKQILTKPVRWKLYCSQHKEDALGSNNKTANLQQDVFCFTDNNSCANNFVWSLHTQKKFAITNIISDICQIRGWNYPK